MNTANHLPVAYKLGSQFIFVTISEEVDAFSHCFFFAASVLSFGQLDALVRDLAPALAKAMSRLFCY